MLSFTKALHEEMRGTGVTLTAVCPGPVRTGVRGARRLRGADDRIREPLRLEADNVRGAKDLA